MNILVITNLFPNPAEPLRSTFNERQFTALAKTSSVVVVSPISWVTKLGYRKRGTLAKIQDCKDWNGVPVHYPTYYYLPKVLAWLRGVTMTASILWRCIRVFKTLKPDVILATWAFPDGFAAVVIGRLLGVPVVIKVHGSDVEALSERGPTRSMALWGLSRAAKVISVSGYLKDKLIEQGVNRDKLAIVYNGVDSELFSVRDREAARTELGLDLKRKTILYVGNLKFDKGLLDLIEALTIQPCRQLNPQLVIIGDGPLRQQLSQQIDERKLNSSVQMVGRKTPVEIANWMSAADCLCLPSHHEGIPNVILEALSCGIPVVATRVGGIPEVVNADNGILVSPKRPGELASALAMILNHDCDRSAVRESSQAKGWDESAIVLEQEIISIIS